MSQTEFELLTRTGAGTPGGTFMRRYWQPAALSIELPPGGAPIPVQILGEELVLFRDDKGQPGLLGLHCAHRGADLSYGRVEDGGLRCIYHGWLYDIKGRCLDQPGEPGGGEHRDAIHQTGYPCQESGGVIFAYMGPGEPPCLPAYEFLEVPENQRLVIKIHQACNYLQGSEGNIDPVHTSFLHRISEDNDQDQYVGVRGSNASFLTLWGRDVAPQLDVELTDFGLRIFTIRNAGAHKHYLRVTNFVYPA
ncbi:MAG: Rieske 2Fe-2S domain-containing protein, partial [Deltaproteobacteria bacterium]|nr:Rieske 2Fe-2S domain-containing protein [Deltaproteobacteria bacterium]